PLPHTTDPRGAPEIARRNFPPPGQLVDVGGYWLHLYCTGESQPGTPTVILETMASGEMVNWAWVQPQVAKATRVCSYDRAGSGWSDLSPSHSGRKRRQRTCTHCSRAPA